jgi:hypothetical protein
VCGATRLLLDRHVEIGAIRRVKQSTNNGMRAPPKPALYSMFWKTGPFRGLFRLLAALKLIAKTLSSY